MARVRSCEKLPCLRDVYKRQNLTDVCRVLSENHLKKVPVLEAGHIVGIINRSDITQYSMAAYLADHPERAVYCGEGPSGQHECVEEACEEC